MARSRKRQRPIHPVCEKLMRLRKTRKISMRELAGHMGYSPDIIGRWERGESHPKLNRLQDWAQSLGQTITVEQRR